MYLFFDTETNGLPQNWNAPVTAVHNWPRMVQLAWIETDESGAETNRKDYVIKPDGFTIPKAVAKVHGITTDRALAEGVALTPVLEEFSQAIERSKTIVAHNMNFDEKIVGAEFIRADIANRLFQTRRVCTMKRSTEFCKIPGNYGYKWPTLTELHLKLFKKPFQEAHNAAIDVAACAKCFFELKVHGVV